MTTVDLSPILDPLVQLAGLVLTGVVGWVGIRVANYAHISAQNSLLQSVLGAVDRGISYGQQVATAAVAKDGTVNLQNAQQAAAVNYVVTKLPGTLKALGMDPGHVADLVLAKLPPATPDTVATVTPKAVQAASTDSPIPAPIVATTPPATPAQ